MLECLMDWKICKCKGGVGRDKKGGQRQKRERTKKEDTDKKGLGRAAGCPTALLQTRASAINAHGSSSYGFARSSYGLYAVVSVDNSPVTD